MYRSFSADSRRLSAAGAAGRGKNKIIRIPFSFLFTIVSGVYNVVKYNLYGEGG